jgi:hypothetical protein
MSEAIHQMFIGMGSLIWAPFGGLPHPGYRITLPPENAHQAIGFDFSRVANDLNRSIDKVQNEKQLELKLKK